jgi:hypothetical protein
LFVGVFDASGGRYAPSSSVRTCCHRGHCCDRRHVFSHAGIRAKSAGAAGAGNPHQGDPDVLQRANITGNSAVFHARLAKPFRDEFSPERLAGVFKAFRDQKINFAVIATKPPVASEPPRIDSGVLKLYGSFDTAPSRLNYLLEFVGSEGEWKASRVEVQLKPIK